MDTNDNLEEQKLMTNNVNDEAATTKRRQQQEQLVSVQRQFASVLYKLWDVHVVIDGNVPLQWSLHQSAKHFCDMYRKTTITTTKEHDHPESRTNVATISYGLFPTSSCSCTKEYPQSIDSIIF
jgi:hypothetical protein